MGILILISLTLISAFFSVSEIALTAARRTKLQMRADCGDHRAAKVLLLREQPGHFFTAAQIGVNSVAILAGVLGEKYLSDLVLDLVSPYMEAVIARRTADIVALVIVTLLFIQFADLVPKRVAMAYPETCAVMVIEPLLAILKLLRPLVWAFNSVADTMLRLCGLKTLPTDDITTADIAAMVDAGAEAGVLRKQELHLIENVFELDSKIITAVMTPRDQVVYLGLEETRESVRSKLVNRPHAHYPVCGRDLDEVLGYLNAKDILRHLVSEEEGAALGAIGHLHDKNVLVVPDTLTLSESLTRFRETHESFAVVMNEYGFMVGVVTLDDIVGALMGDVLYSHSDEQVVRRDESSWLVDGVTPIGDLKKALGTESLAGEDYVDTAGGLVIYALKRVPKKSEFIVIGGFRFEVLDIDNHKIDQLLVSKVAPIDRGEKVVILP
ncbi:hemolysin family protein [Cupriavidus pampae]|uniref:Polyamine export protein n=1 Tax=Cupriavidus pampae TaxID=659251 RepID=A0ABM8XZL2_9BURK|nr:hemolysin family protein [Cupriavidus pampae]CAG9185894.1 hypothetical protein LMG32289_06148 [Cupriavidus pampae]